MTKVYKVSLFDDSQKGKRTELGLHVNCGMIFITADYEEALSIYKLEIEYCRLNCKSHNLRLNEDERGISVNIASGMVADKVIRWNWTEQSYSDYIF